MSEYRLVYSSDPQENKKCPVCKEIVAACECKPVATVPDIINALLSIEKAKRGGKVVTMIRKLPPVEDYLKTLTKDIKKMFGTGGTYGIDNESGYIEVQGDRRDALREILRAKNIVVKG